MDNETPPIPPSDLPPRDPHEPDDDPFGAEDFSAHKPPTPDPDEFPAAEGVEARPRRERKPGGARERHERRKQHVTSAKPAGAPRQLRPPSDFKLPTISIPRGNTLIGLLGVVGAVLLVVVLVAVLGRLRNTPAERFPNALWLGTEWTYDQRTDEEIAVLVQNLRTRKIGTVYAWVSFLQFDGTWRAQDQFGNVTSFVERFNEAYPEALLVGWVSLPTVQADRVTTRINDVSLQEEVAAFSKRAIDEFGFEGIFLNAEPVWDGDQDFLALLRAVRAAIGINVPLSAAIPPDWSPSNSNIPLPPLIEPGTEWETPYKQSVALLVDHMAVMAYQSGLSSAGDYTQWVAYQVRAFAQAIADLNISTGLIIGIPTFDAEPPGHDPLVENIATAVQGINLGLEQAGDAARYVEGVAVYADWTTTDDEWAVYQQMWANAS